MTIQISGLNTRQKNIMDLLWSCTTLDQVKTLISAMPTLQDRCDAQSLIVIATQESIEQEVGFTQEVQDAANDCISRAMR